eukprot:scaffold38261_cov21-Tisochrysis_lutea.AAC.1
MLTPTLNYFTPPDPPERSLMLTLRCSPNAPYAHLLDAHPNAHLLSPTFHTVPCHQVEDLRAGRLAPLEPLFKDPPPSPSQPAQSQPPPSPSLTSSDKAAIENAVGTLEAATCEVESQPSLTPSESCALKLGGGDVTTITQHLHPAAAAKVDDLVP